MELAGTTEAFFGKDTIKAIVLFGSVAHGDFNKISDVDILLILHDSVPRSRIYQVEPLLKALEYKYQLAEYPSSWHMRINATIEKSTGMYCSHFVCRESDWTHQNFARIFNINRLLALILAPNRLVLDSLAHGSKILYGTIQFPPPLSRYPSQQILKSLSVSLILAIGGFLILPFRSTYIKYLLESYKWALRSCYYFLFHRSSSIKAVAATFHNFGISKEFLQRFLNLRNHPDKDPRFFFALFYELIHIHIITLQYRNENDNNSKLTRENGGYS
jgi:predicted nucleotidyltransferase